MRNSTLRITETWLNDQSKPPPGRKYRLVKRSNRVLIQFNGRDNAI